jgi:hypothetical protein
MACVKKVFCVKNLSDLNTNLIVNAPTTFFHARHFGGSFWDLSGHPPGNFHAPHGDIFHAHILGGHFGTFPGTRPAIFTHPTAAFFTHTFWGVISVPFQAPTRQFSRIHGSIFHADLLGVILAPFWARPQRLARIQVWRRFGPSFDHMFRCGF